MQSTPQSGPEVFDVTPQNFQSGVVERSRQVPVVMLFWAEQMQPSVEARRDLEALARQFQGKFLVGLVDVARDPALAQQLRIQTLPSIRVVDQGQLVHQLDGPQPEAALRQLAEQLAMSPADLLQEDLAELIAGGRLPEALQLLRRSLEEEPQNAGFQVELADLLARMGDLDEARTLLARIPADTPNRERPEARIGLLEEAVALPDLAELERRHQAAVDDLEIRYQLALRLAAADAIEPALDQAMAILQADREFRDDLGRRTMLRLFNLLGKGSEIASRYRRRMFNFLH